MFEKGIIDCFLIVKTALEDAVSIGNIASQKLNFII